MKKFFPLLFCLLLHSFLFAQELNVNVTINTPKLQTADPKVFETLETAITEFMNNQKWTNDVFEEDERIKVDLVITITDELSPTSFKADLAVQSVRPVFGSTYQTPLLKHNDKDMVFFYEEYQPLEYSQTAFQDNLTSILSFYAYIILGLDYDSFSLFGGEPYFQEAQDIISLIPPTVARNFKGWRSTDSNRNRYWLIENLLTPRTRAFRQAIYDYHRQSLDIMYKDPATARAIMRQAIEAIGEVNNNYPNSMILQTFANTKVDEIVEIFKNGTSQEKEKVIRVMQRVDAPHASAYRKIRG